MKDASTPPTDAQAEAQRDTLMDAQRKANEQQPGSFKDEAVTDKVVEIPARPKDEKPIEGLDPASR